MWTTELAVTVILSWEHVVIKVKDPGNPVRRTDRREASVILISFIRKAPKNKGLISPKLHFYLRSFYSLHRFCFLSVSVLDRNGRTIIEKFSFIFENNGGNLCGANFTQYRYKF